MIVEYLGIPGCGKTYQANLYKKGLESKGISYIDLSRWKGSPIWIKLFYKLTDKTFVLIPKYRLLRKDLLFLCKDYYNNKPQYLPFSVDYCIDRIISSIFLQDIFGEGKKIAINDEGLLQWVVFLSVQYGVSIYSIMHTLLPLNPNCKTEWIDTPVEVAFSNIRKRNRHICPMDEMEDIELKSYLLDFYDRCEQISSIKI